MNDYCWIVLFGHLNNALNPRQFSIVNLLSRPSPRPNFPRIPAVPNVNLTKTFAVQCQIVAHKNVVTKLSLALFIHNSLSIVAKHSSKIL